jgi:ATP phosphoribosyltransferase
MQIIDTIMSSTTVLIANKRAWENPVKRAKIEDVALLLTSAIEGKKKVGLKMNLHKDNLQQVGAL